MPAETFFDNFENLYSLIKKQQEMYSTIFRLGEKSMLEKVMREIKLWEVGKYSNEEFKKIIEDLKQKYVSRQPNNQKEV